MVPASQSIINGLLSKQNLPFRITGGYRFQQNLAKLNPGKLFHVPAFRFLFMGRTVLSSVVVSVLCLLSITNWIVKAFKSPVETVSKASFILFLISKSVWDSIAGFLKSFLPIIQTLFLSIKKGLVEVPCVSPDSGGVASWAKRTAPAEAIKRIAKSLFILFS